MPDFLMKMLLFIITFTSKLGQIHSLHSEKYSELKQAIKKLKYFLKSLKIPKIYYIFTKKQTSLKLLIFLIFQFLQ